MQMTLTAQEITAWHTAHTATARRCTSIATCLGGAVQVTYISCLQPLSSLEPNSYAVILEARIHRERQHRVSRRQGAAISPKRRTSCYTSGGQLYTFLFAVPYKYCFLLWFWLFSSRPYFFFFSKELCRALAVEL